MKALVTLTVVVAMAALVPAQAQKIDLANIKCRDLFNRPKEQIEAIVMWLQGYYTLENAPRVVDYDKMKADSVKLGEYCRSNPDYNVVTAADEVMGE